MTARSTTHRLLFLTAIGLSLVGCSPKKEYILSISKTDPETHRRTTERETFKATNDTSAYKEAYHKFWIKKLSAAELNKNYSNVSTWEVPESFTLTDVEGLPISYSETESARLTADWANYFEKKFEEVLGSQTKRDVRIDSADEKRAYKNFQFGLPYKEFKKDKTFNYYDSIGEYQYKVHPYFNNDENLYMINIESTYPRTANYYDTEVKDQHRNLVTVISEKYGSADQITAYPSFLDMHPGRIQFNNTWNLGDKIIRIGVAEDENTYYAVCWIYSERMKKQYDESREKEKAGKRAEDKDKF